MEKILLHCCCAPCSGAILEWMMNEGIRPVLFFCNPNIFPEAEYRKREEELLRHAGGLGLEVIRGEWTHDAWLAAVKGLENEPERGRRCLACFRVRLYETARVASARGYDTIATTLASSRWKSLAQVSEAGAWAVSQFPGVAFWDRNWRKGGLQERRSAIIREKGFYNQLYCGCEFSMASLAERERRREERESATRR